MHWTFRQGNKKTFLVSSDRSQASLQPLCYGTTAFQIKDSHMHTLGQSKQELTQKKVFTKCAEK